MFDWRDAVAMNEMIGEIECGIVVLD